MHIFQYAYNRQISISITPMRKQKTHIEYQTKYVFKNNFQKVTQLEAFAEFSYDHQQDSQNEFRDSYFHSSYVSNFDLNYFFINSSEFHQTGISHPSWNVIKF